MSQVGEIGKTSSFSYTHKGARGSEVNQGPGDMITSLTWLDPLVANTSTNLFNVVWIDSVVNIVLKKIQLCDVICSEKLGS